MTEAYKSIAGLIPTAMATGMVQHNLNYLNSKKKKKSITRLAVDNIVGTSMIQSTANIVGGL